MKKLPYGRFELVVREMSADEQSITRAPERAAGVYLNENFVVLDDLTMWKVVDKIEIEEEVVKKKSYDE